MRKPNRPEVHVMSFDIYPAKVVAEQLKMISESFPPQQAIVMRIDSHGGSVAGLSIIVDAMKSIPNEIITYTSSVAYSAGAILLALGDKRAMSPEANAMIHEIQAGAGGDIKDVTDRKNNMDRINDLWMGKLADSMGLEGGRNGLRKLISENAEGQDLYLTPEKAQELGLIDEIGHITMQGYLSYDVSLMKQSKGGENQPSPEEIEKLIEDQMREMGLIPAEPEKPQKKKKVAKKAPKKKPVAKKAVKKAVKKPAKKAKK